MGNFLAALMKNFFGEPLYFFSNSTSSSVCNFAALEARTRMPVKFTLPFPSWWWSETRWLTSLRLLMEMPVWNLKGKDEGLFFSRASTCNVGSSVVKRNPLIPALLLIHPCFTPVKWRSHTPGTGGFCKKPSRIGEVKLDVSKLVAILDVHISRCCCWFSNTPTSKLTTLQKNTKISIVNI